MPTPKTKTVKELKVELDKFPDDALCHAYIGGQGWEGLIVKHGGMQGFIYCSDTDVNRETELLSNDYDGIV